MISQNKIKERLPREDGKEISSEQIEAIKEAYLENACETIVDLINDFFKVIVTESMEE